MIRYTRSKFNYENIFKDIKNVEKFIRKRLNSYKVFNKIKQLEKEIFYQHTIKSQRATDVLKYPSSPKWKNQKWPGVGSVERWIQ